MADQLKPNELPPLNLQALDQELRNEEAYGGKPLEAAAGAAASSATFGLSDAALTAAGVSPERLREVRDREAEAALVGTVGGIVGPAIVSGGSSLAAKGVSAGVRGATRAGLAAEAAATKALAPKIGETAASIAAKGVGGAVEGAAAGAGQLVSDVALDRKELSGEAALAAVGSGALLGAGFGTALGTAQATLPKAFKSLSGNLKGARKLAAEGMDELTNPNKAAVKVLTHAPGAELKLEQNLGKYLEDLPTYLKTNLNLEDLSSPTQLLQKNAQKMGEAAEQIGTISKRLDELTATGQVPVTRAEAWQPLLDRVNLELQKLGTAKNITAPERRIINRYRDDIIAAGISDKPFSFREFNTLRQSLQGKAYKGGGALESFEAEFANALRYESRQIVDDIAAKASELEPNLANGLREANKNYHLGATIEPFLEKTATRQPGFTSPFKFAADTATRAIRNRAVISDVASKTQQVQGLISKSIDNYFKPAVAKLGKVPVGLSSTKALLSSGFSIDSKTEKMPKDKSTAFDNVRRNVTELQSDPEALIELIAKRTARVANADPGVAAAMQTSLASAVNFLAEKMPKPAVQAGLFNRPYKPSSMEIAKFERYLQVIEKPLTVLEDLEQGTLTREHVEALKAVYPEIYKEVQQAAIDKITSGSKLPYNARIQLGILLDIPADSSLAPESVLQLQQSIMAPPEQTEASLPPESLDLASREQSGTEKVASRT